ncbi:hypothetical protein NDU88_001055 [Pleurodeles waltl]|uniref:Uncharacterized protein n=1 Tax=Pleurodeles waltl TaxID=8319 RepID=A0AAV7MKF7_PLEWA|nr:hypothetical protein NDU88_001055 [Pleurodeles waltl]
MCVSSSTSRKRSTMTRASPMEKETLARSSREVLRTLRNTVDFCGEGKKSMIGTKWFVDDEVSNDMSSQCEFGVPVRHANETQVVGGNGVPMQSDEVTEKRKRNVQEEGEAERSQLFCFIVLSSLPENTTSHGFTGTKTTSAKEEGLDKQLGPSGLAGQPSRTQEPKLVAESCHINNKSTNMSPYRGTPPTTVVSPPLAPVTTTATTSAVQPEQTGPRSGL